MDSFVSHSNGHHNISASTKKTKHHGSSPIQQVVANGFSKGAIVKISLKDFMTYNKVDFYPGPNLNLILGPNGTGKSTVVSAIYLGMNGKPSSLSRASSLGGFVRHGASKAVIEIELYSPNGENFHITREITVDNKSTWKFQGSIVTRNQIEEVIHGLHIQVDNLCQFLPQEQVQNFSRMNDKQLLISTMNAVGNPELEEQFQALKKMQSEYGNVESNQEKNEEEVRKLRAENARSESEVNSFREREELKVTVKLLEKKRAWMIYEEEEKRWKDAEEIADDLKKQYDRAAARFQPLEKAIRKREFHVKKAEEKLKSKRESGIQGAMAVNQKLLSAEQWKSKMDTAVAGLNSKRTQETKRLAEIKTDQQFINSLEGELEALIQKERESVAEIQEIDRQIREHDPGITAASQAACVAKEEWNQAKNELHEQKSKLSNVEDVDKNRLNKLREDRPDLYNAVMWLRNNKERFNHPIYEPLILSLNVRNVAMAKYIENTISFNDITAFYCEDKNDMNELIRVLRGEKRLAGINVVHAPAHPYNEPSTAEYQPRVAISELREYGFHSYLRELFTAPEPVVRYHCKWSQIHNIPVGDDRAFDNFGMIRDRFGQIFSLFFGGNKRIGISRSKYRSDAITQISDLRPSNLLGQTVNAELLEQLRASVATCEERAYMANKAMELASQEETALKRAREGLLQRKKACQKVVSDRRVVQTRLDQKRQHLQILEREAIDLAAEERKVKAECAQLVRKVAERLKEHVHMVDQFLAREKEKEALQVYLSVMQASVASSRVQLANEKDQIKQLESEKETAERESQATKQRALTALAEARQVSGVRRASDLPDDVKRQFTKLPNILAEVEESIHSANARIQLMGRGDQTVVREYEEREKRIQQLTAHINTITSRAASLKNDLDKLKGAFLPPLLELVSRINNSFGRFYASLKCAGEVVLYTGEGEDKDDFENYGIKIRVKYRSKEPLIDLSASHHSGGERAVATALYMLAMQELTRVPFRCVDEINQGMDPLNERRVFELLVQTACERESAQYFLLTPKLLPGLNYSSNMKIHFVQNGEFVCDQWNVANHLQLIQAMSEQRD